jgi:hypothetical protein
MPYDFIYFKLYVCFDFQNLSIYDYYMYYYWPIHQIHHLLNFLEVSRFSRNC